MFRCLLICLTVSSRKKYPLTPVLSRVFLFICRALAETEPTYDLYIYTRESFLKVQDVQWICWFRFCLTKTKIVARKEYSQILHSVKSIFVEYFTVSLYYKSKNMGTNNILNSKGKHLVWISWITNFNLIQRDNWNPLDVN